MDDKMEKSNIETNQGIKLKQKQAVTHIKKKKIKVTYTSTKQITLKKAMENLIKIKSEKNYEKS